MRTIPRPVKLVVVAVQSPGERSTNPKESNVDRFFVKLQTAVAEHGSERGASGVEYGILVAAIAALIVALAFLIGGEIQAAFQTVYDELI